MNRFDVIFDNSLDEIFMFDSNTLKFLRVNPPAKTNLGYGQEKFSDMTLLDIMRTFSRESFEGMLEKLRRGELEKIKFKALFHRENGNGYLAKVELFGPTEGNPHVFIAMARDISQGTEPEVHFRKSLEKTMNLTGFRFSNTPAGAPLASTHVSGFSISSALARVGGNESLYLHLLEKFKNNYAGVPANLKAALGKNERGQAHGIIHGIKGVSGNIGAVHLSRVAAKLETVIKNEGIENEGPLLREFEEAFESTLVSIGEILDSFSKPGENVSDSFEKGSPVDKNRVLPVLNELADLVEEDLMAAAEKMEALKQLLENTGMYPMALEIERCLKQYRTDSAMEGINRLSRNLNMDSEG